MAQRELDILADARVTLNDTSDVPRWSTERLLGFLSDAQEDMCKSIPLLTHKSVINTVPGQEEYNLPEGSMYLISASSAGIALPIIPYDMIERDNPDWDADTSSVLSAVIVNALSQQVIRPYPLVSVSKPIKIRYQVLPVRLGYDSVTKDTVEELTISDMWDSGLKQYIIGMAFLDYGDESSIARSQMAMSLYNNEYSKAMKLSKSSFSKVRRTTGFQGKVAHLRGGLDGSSCFGFRG